MSDFLSRLAERVQGRTQVAKPLIASRFAASPWPTVGDAATPVREEDLERGPAPAGDRNDPLPEPQETAKPEEQPEAGIGTPLHRPMRPAQDRPSASPAAHQPEVLNSPGSPTTSVAPHATSDSEGAAEGGRTSQGLPHPEVDPIEETEGAGDETESRRRTPESSQKPSSASHARAEYIDKSPTLMPQEQGPAVSDQHSREGDVAERRISASVEPGYGVEVGPASPETETGGLQDESRQDVPTSATEYAPEEEGAQASTRERRIADRKHGTRIWKLPDQVEEYEMSGLEALRIPPLRQVPEEDSARIAGGLPSIEPPALRGERAGGQSPELFAREPSWSQAPLVEQVEGRPSTHPPPSPPSVRVIIGRVEVRAVRPPEPPEARPSSGPRSPRVTLDDYLEERSGGGS